MIFIVKKNGKQYLVTNRLTKHIAAVRSTNSKAQRLAAQLEREQRHAGCRYVDLLRDEKR